VFESTGIQACQGAIESIGPAQDLVEDHLADMAERSMAEVMAEGDRFGELFVDAQRPRHGPRKLRDLERVGDAGAVVVARLGQKDLALVLEAAEGP